MALLSSCERPAPVGQVVASIDGADITMREIGHELGDTQSDAQRRPQTLEQVVTRKILAQEAEKRALQRTGEYHFALRAAREALLVDALRRDVRAGLAKPDAQAIDKEMAQHPWLYGDRFALVLAYPGLSEAALIIDSAELATAPPRALHAAAPGDLIKWDGRDWQVLSRHHQTEAPERLRQHAADVLATRATEETLSDIVEKYRQGGHIRYQSGWGAAAGDSR